MYIKFNFTSDKQLNYIFRVVNEIINNTGITSIATLQTVATNNTWDASLLQYLDTVNSEIIRTGTGTTGLTTAKTVSNYQRNGANGTYSDEHAWTVEFSRYDDTSRKYYVQHINTAGPGNFVTYARVADSLSSGTISSNGSYSPTTAPLGGTGSPPSLSSPYVVGTPGSSSSGFTNIRTFVMYISDTCMIWSATATTTYNVGFGPSYNDPSKYIGPFIYSQYTRFDYHNTNANGITPLMFTNVNRAIGSGFGYVTADWTSAENSQFNTTSSIAFKVFNLVNAYPTTGASYPVVAQPYVNWGVGSRYTDFAGLTVAGAGSTTDQTIASYGPVIFTTVGTRYPSADLKSLTYGMLPVSWRNLYYYNAGGDASAKGGWYLFNGDYFPGDEFTYNGKTYKILPTYTGYSARVGIAIPKE